MNEHPTPGMLRALALMVGLSARAWVNRIAAGFAAKRAARTKPSGTPATVRRPTPGKRRFRIAIAVLMLPLFLWQGVVVAGMFITRMADRLDPVPHLNRDFLATYGEKMQELSAMRAEAESHANPEWTRWYGQCHERVSEWTIASLRTERAVRDLPEPEREAWVAELAARLEHEGVSAARPVARLILLPGPELWPAKTDQSDLVRAMALFYLLLAVMLLCISLGSAIQDLGQVEGHTLWLASLPTPATTLFLAKILEYTLVNAFLWLTALPLTAVMLGCAGWGWWSIPVAIAATCAFGATLSSLRLGIETLLRMRFPPGSLKNLQALFTLGSLGMMLVIYGVMFAPRFTGYFCAYARRFPAEWNPLSLTAELARNGSGFASTVIIAATAAAAIAAAVTGCAWAVRGGFLIQANAFVGKRAAAPSAPAGRALSILGKDLLLLRRDRNFLVQTLALPAFMVGLQLVVNQDMASGIAHDFRHGATLAYGVAAYLLVNTAMGVLNLEGGALWLLYTAPQPLERLLMRKTCLWAGIAAGYAAVTMAILAWFVTDLPATAIEDILLVLAGAVVYAFIGAGIGILASDPLEQNPKRRINVAAVYLFMMLSAMYAHAIYQPSGFAKLAQLALSALLAFALWQKVRDRIPYLLDPTAAPPPTISVSDGMIATLAFFVLQGVLTLLLLQAQLPIGPAVTIAYGAAGLSVASFCMYLFWRLKIPDLGRMVGLRARAGMRAPYARAIGIGVVGGALTGGCAALYLGLIDRVPALHALRAEVVELTGSGDGRWWFAGLAVVAAPLCEEFIFRGLLFSGLRRTVPLAWAVFGSAAIFALVHPPMSVIPVFCLGVATALAYHVSGLLVASILVHAIYNAIVLALQLH
ncbi:MAG: CPBP family intramembrane metalloprotease [Planctomycetes bacterium]|nr:CPBP family intramembrane metalloprotease [Planctomycetota bacterium]